MSAFVVLVLLSAANGDRPPVARPHTSAAKPFRPMRVQPPAKPEPPQPPEPPAEPTDEPDDTADAPDDSPPPSQVTEPDSPTEPTKDDDGLSPEVNMAIGFGSMCCCLIAVAGFGVMLYFIFRKKPAQPGAAVAAMPMAPVSSPTPAHFHLSVLALGMQAGVQPQVAQSLLLAGTSPDPTTAAERALLVRELAKALRNVEVSWSHFGYGERTDLLDEAAAARSYQLAVDDFKTRSRDGSQAGDSSVVVSTLVLCTRRQLQGVSALDDRAQIRTMLDDRSRLLEADLLGAYWVWSPALSSGEVLTRFPEMHALN